MEVGSFLVFNGLVNGFLIALIALGLALIFGIMKIINMAHGDLYMLGAVGAVVFVGSGIPFWVALVVLPLVLGGLAVPFERYVLRPMEGSVLATMIATLGLSFILQQLALIWFGGQPRRLAEPVSFTVDMFGLAYPGYRLVAAGIGVVLLLVVWLGVFKSRLGLSLRVTIDRPDIADAMGINTSRVRALAFGLGTALAVVGGVLAAPINNVSHLMGNSILLVAFIVVIVGGMGSLGGALFVALLMASVEGGITAWLTPVEAQIAVLLLMSVVVLARPRGLFGKAAS